MIHALFQRRYVDSITPVLCDLSCKGWAYKVFNEDKFVCSASLILYEWIIILMLNKGKTCPF